MTADDAAVILSGLGGRTFVHFTVASGIHLGLDREPNYTITIECPVTISESGEPLEVQSTPVLEKLRELLMSEVDSVEQSGGMLTISFGGGAQIVVPPDELYEAWQVNADDGSLVVCMPGGELAVWAPESAT